MVSGASPLGAAPSRSSEMRQQSSIVAPSGGSLTTSTGRPRRVGGVGDIGFARHDRPRVDQGQDELQNRRGHEIEILNVDLGRVHARPDACAATTACVGLLAAHDLGAVGEETLGRSRYGAEFLEKWMREPVGARARRVACHLDLPRGSIAAAASPRSHVRRPRRALVVDERKGFARPKCARALRDLIDDATETRLAIRRTTQACFRASGRGQAGRTRKR